MSKTTDFLIDLEVGESVVLFELDFLLSLLRQHHPQQLILVERGFLVGHQPFCLNSIHPPFCVVAVLQQLFLGPTQLILVVAVLTPRHFELTK